MLAARVRMVCGSSAFAALLAVAVNALCLARSHYVATTIDGNHFQNAVSVSTLPERSFLSIYPSVLL